MVGAAACCGGDVVDFGGDGCAVPVGELAGVAVPVEDQAAYVCPVRWEWGRSAGGGWHVGGLWCGDGGAGMEAQGAFELTLAWVFAGLAAVMLFAPSMLAAVGIGFAAAGVVFAVRNNAKGPMALALVAALLLLPALERYLT